MVLDGLNLTLTFLFKAPKRNQRLAPSNSSLPPSSNRKNELDHLFLFLLKLKKNLDKLIIVKANYKTY